MAQSYVKALYDYNSKEVSDLKFRKGDVIKVLMHVDENWISGELHGSTGLFPSNFVEAFVISSFDPKVVCPNTASSLETTVIANDTYISGEDGVLTFFCGDQLTFLERVDEYWCRGIFAGEVGLFPSHLVDGLPRFSVTSDTNYNPPESSHVTESINNLLPTKSKTDLEPSIVGPHVKALFDFEGLSEFELSFPAGKLVHLTKDVDADWFEGSIDGEIGIFPKSFVKVIVPLSNDAGSPHVQACIPDSDNPPVPYAIAVYPFVGETQAELSFKAGDVILLHHWVSPEWIEGECNGFVGIFPSAFVEIKLSLPQEFEEDSIVKENGNILSHSSNDKPEVFYPTLKIGDQTVAIYTYYSDLNGDLCFNVGDTVWIEQVIDDEWVVGRKDEEVGLCPAVFLELVTPEAVYNSNTSMKSSEVSNDFVRSDSPSHGLLNGKIEQLPDQNNLSGDIEIEHGEVIANVASPLQSISPVSELEEVNTNNFESDQPLPNISDTAISADSQVSGIKISPENGSSIAATKMDSTVEPERPTSLSFNRKHLLGPKPLISPKPDFLKKKARPVSRIEKPVLSPKPMTSSRRSSDIFTSNESNWVTFQGEGLASTSSNIKSEHPPQDVLSKASITSSSLENALENNVTSLLDDVPRECKPVPLARTDFIGSKSSNEKILASKLMEQAEEFEITVSRQVSPSLNELREMAKSAKPVPAKRQQQQQQQQQPLSSSTHDRVPVRFPLWDNLDEQIKRLNNELQKENQVLSGVAVLIHTTNEGTEKRTELESKKGITERKIMALKGNLDVLRDRKDRLMKTLSGFSTLEEIDLKMQQLKETIKENCETKDNLLSLLPASIDDEQQQELLENISFCDDATKNLTSELSRLQDAVAELENRTQDPSMDGSQRKKVIDEILSTERSFALDLNLCLKYFKEQLIQWKVGGIDIGLLFGNMDEVADLSSRLLTRLETATVNVDTMEQTVGSCFVEFSDEMTTIYAKYCKNHDEAIAFLEKTADDKEIQKYFGKCLELMREFSHCWDLASFLIKPVQRILKYPLLLNELLKNTPSEHPDRQGLIEAIRVMTIAASDVNETKRRKELVQKYQKVEESGLGTKFQKFTWHSVMKKSSRFNQRITQFTGLVSQTVDEKFNENERLFYQIEKTAKNFVKNVAQYLELFEAVHESQVQSCKNIAEFLRDNPMAPAGKNIKEYDDVQRYIAEELVHKLKKVLDEEVQTPLNALLNLFQGPHRLIQKRRDKCLDYDRWSHKAEKIKDREKWKQVKEEMDLAKKNYEALNTQLLDELPVLNRKSLALVQTCITNFACVHKNFFLEALDQFSPSVQISLLNSSVITSAGNIDLHDVFDITFTTKKSLSISRPLAPSFSPYVTSGNSYIVKYSFSAEAPAELSVDKDSIVHVLQHHDAFGHSEWWKCEHNGKVGFVPSSFLVPL